MTQEFSPSDFLPLKQQTTVLLTTLTTPPHPSPLHTPLLPALTALSTTLSTLHLKALNPSSLLRLRCADRHGEWLQILFDITNTLCECQDLISSSPSPSLSPYTTNPYSTNNNPYQTNSYLTNPYTISNNEEISRLEGELRTHAWTLEVFLDSLGISKLGRSDPALGEVERILMDVVREERLSLSSPQAPISAQTSSRPANYSLHPSSNFPSLSSKGGKTGDGGQEAEPPRSKLHNLHNITTILLQNGVEKSEIERLDTRIKQLAGWVLRNEREVAGIREGEERSEVGGVGGGSGDGEGDEDERRYDEEGEAERDFGIGIGKGKGKGKEREMEVGGEMNREIRSGSENKDVGEIVKDEQTVVEEKEEHDSDLDDYVWV